MKQRVMDVAHSLLLLLCYVSCMTFDSTSSVLDKGCQAVAYFVLTFRYKTRKQVILPLNQK